MEWVETTAKTVDEAQERALDQLRVARDEAEFEVIEEPRSGLFGLLRGEARVRARVRPEPVRPKQDRRGRGRKGDQAKKSDGDRSKRSGRPESSGGSTTSDRPARSDRPKKSSGGNRRDEKSSNQQKENDVPETTVTPQEVGDAAVTFMQDLAGAFGADAEVAMELDGTEIDVTVSGDELGLMVGPSGRTLNAIQDLARVAAQRRLGDHETRLRVDIGGYRERRRTALESFTHKVAAEVVETGTAKALEPMASADRKVVHDTVTGIDGVESRSDGDDPGRRVVIAPA